jgi:hypothetical protein
MPRRARGGYGSVPVRPLRRSTRAFLSSASAKLYRLPLNSLAALLAELASRVETFVARPDSLATFALKPLPSDVDLAALRSTLDRRRTSGAFGDTLSDAHLALALTGWTLAGSTHLPTLACARCNRTASVGAFTPTTRAFDGLGEHRPFCAFVEEAAWRRQLPRRRTRAEAAGEEFKWAWSGEGTKRRLAVRTIAGSVSDARLIPTAD